MTIDDEEKTARGGLGPPRALAVDSARARPAGREAPVVRSTAPAGTPAKPSDPASHLRVQSAEPRTVGGHTARLNVADAPPPSAPQAIPAPAPTPAPALTPRGAGGTVRMDAGLPGPPPPPAPTITGLPDASPLAAQAAHSPGHDGASQGTASRADPHAAAPVPSPPPAAGAADPGETPAWLSPLSVAVGLVFFATGSMLALATDGRLSARAPIAAAASAAPTAAATTARVEAPAAPATTSSASAAPAASASTSATAPTPATTHTAPPHTGKPAAVPVGPGKNRPGKTGLPFRDP